MFHFFGKKRFLADYLENFVDIHNHILPGLDDGAQTMDDSLTILKGFQELGIKNFVATPHIMQNYYPNTPETIGNSLNQLQNELLKNNWKDVYIEAAAEHMIDANFESLLENKEVMPLRKNYLLVEMSYLQPPLNFEEAIAKVASQGFFPILAHPERYGFLHHQIKKYAGYKEKGILFQMNLLSLGNYYGNAVPKVARKLLEEGFIDFVASDVHNIQQLQTLKNLTVSKKTLELVLPVIDKTIGHFY
ncbi:histidinol phosphatase [Flavobacteriaceae bacterium F89]|uniref:protein-tyrosine-phosphatase n=1 Tax=Cerina litoralis TaxID=2874477 RepID=A0AAE3EWP9_9FLAO|nr:CpsB/CapC family capsule biosynthesis tyrosine phosphatase [Cerina litoralis]MCG2461890.1 histidinol phosphatase [Cerina litoralis]